MASRMPALLLGLLASLTAPAILAVEALPAAASFCLPNVAGAEAETSKVRRRPGRPIDRYELPVCDPDTTDNNAMTPWVDPLELGAPVPDRWRIVEAIGITTNLWDPYNGHNPLKGDLHVWGDDWFYSLIAISDTVLEPRRFPIPVGGATTARPGSLDTIGAGQTTVLSQSLII